MMYHTNALILKKDEWSEADWLITALTEDFGKMRLRAQGARKHGAKLQGHLEPGSLSEIWFVAGRNGYRLTTARLQEFFPGIRSSWSKLRGLDAVLAAAEQNLLEEHEASSEPFAAAVAALTAIERAEGWGAVLRLLAWFQVSLLGALGLLPAPGTPEASGIPDLLALAGGSAERAEALAINDDALAAELTALGGRLGDSARLIVPVAAAGPVVH